MHYGPGRRRESKELQSGNRLNVYTKAHLSLEGIMKERFNLLLVHDLRGMRNQHREVVDRYKIHTFEPVATELVGSRPAYNGYLPL